MALYSRNAFRVSMDVSRLVAYYLCSESQYSTLEYHDILHQFSTRVGSDLGSGRVKKILTDFEFYIREIAGLHEIMVLLL